MGKGVSKQKEKLVSRDWKYIETQDPGKIKHLDKWIRKYEFDGRLNTQKITALQDAIRTKTKGNPKKMKE